MASKKSAAAQYMEAFFAACKEKENGELLTTFRGVLYPDRLCSPETFEALEAMEARKDDVLIVAYPKCGTNWTLHILNEMIAAIPGNEDLPSPEHFQMIEFGPPEKFQKLKNQPSPRVFVTHLHYDNLPKSFIEKKTKILVIFRNPKDAAVSYFHFYNKNPLLPNITSWDEFFQKFMSGEVCWKSYFDHALVWDKHVDDENIKIMTFEDMKENLYEAVKQIAQFHEFSLPDETIRTIADKATFQEMSSKSSETHGSFAPVLFRKGAVGDWKTLFTEAQSKEMDAKFEECLAGTKLGAMLKYQKHCTI
ncbi:sulfotransferase 6B1-like [Eublepharis macularius]|uniref:Sulfotransferase n=1 Tax=Eublepharis macularius TaxID=481883 RepID=A0AA97JEN0_EUBMA|nr:sulfotransferase 6B1-like [Eublepharis macularius]